jgi:hypothetical protein
MLFIVKNKKTKLWEPLLKISKDFCIGESCGRVGLFHYSKKEHQPNSYYRAVYKFSDGYRCYHCRKKVSEKIMTIALLADIYITKISLEEEIYLEYDRANWV